MDTEIEVEGSSFEIDEPIIGISSTEIEILEIGYGQIQNFQLKEVRSHPHFIIHIQISLHTYHLIQRTIA